MSDDLLAFDDIVVGTTIVYSSSFFDLLLAEREQYAIQLVVDAIQSVSSVTLTLETGADGRNWSPKNPVPEIASTTTIGAGTQKALYGGDLGFKPACGFVRLKIQLGSGSARVRAYVQGASARRPEPPLLPGSTVWLRSDRGIAIQAGSSPQAVRTWADLSGNGNNATQTTTSRQPYFNTIQINGKPTVVFDASSAGSEKYLSLPSLAALLAGHVFLINKRASSPPSSSTRAGFWRLGSSANSSHVPFTDNTIYEDCGSTVRKTCGGVLPGVTLTNAHCYEIRTAANSWTSYFNGTQQFTTVTNTVGFSSTPELGGHTTVNTFYDGYVAELVIFNRVLTTFERSLLVRYFNQRYAIGMS